MHEPRPSETSTSPASLRRRELAHPDHQSSRPRLHRAQRPSRLEQLLDAARGGDEQEATSSSPRPRPSASESSSSAMSSAVGAGRRAPLATIAPSMSVDRLRRRAARSRCRVIDAERVDVGGAEDVADLAQRGQRHLGRPASTPSRPHSALGVAPAGRAAATIASMSPKTGSTTAVTSALGGADGVDGLGQRQRAAPTARRCRPGGRASPTARCAALPEPMLASSRSASSCRSVYRAHSRRPWSGGSARGGRWRRPGVGERVAVDDQRDVAVGQHGAAGEGGARSPTSGGSGRVTSSRWPTSRSTASASRCSRAADDRRRSVGVARRRRGRAPRAASSSGSTPSRMHQHRARPATERTVWSARRSVRSTRSSGIANGAPPASTSSADMIASVSGRRICAVVPWPELGGHARPRRRARGSRVRTASMPTPRPEMSLVARRSRSRARRAARSARAHVDRARRRPAAISPRSAALRGDPGGVDAAAVVADGDDDVAAGVAGGDLERAGRAACRPRRARPASRGRGRASCGRGGRAGRRARRRPCGRARCPGRSSRSSTCLPSLRGEVADEAREAQEDGLDRDHAHLHDHRLQRLRAARQVLHRLRAGPGRRPAAASASTAVRCTTSSPMRCISWSRRSASTRTVLDALRVAGAALGGRRGGLGRGAALAAAGLGARRRRRDLGDVDVGDVGDRGGAVGTARRRARSASQASTTRPSKPSSSSVGRASRRAARRSRRARPSTM